MRHLGVDDIARDERHEKIVHAVLLSGAAGKNGDRLSVLLLETENLKADGFADARDDGDILDLLAGGSFGIRTVPTKLIERKSVKNITGGNR